MNLKPFPHLAKAALRIDLGRAPVSDSLSVMTLLSRRKLAVVLCGFLAFASIPVMAWDAEGHELVAKMAFDQLNTKAKDEVDRLAREVENPDRLYNVITIACWMDDIRKGPPAMLYHGMFPSWHYIDIGIAPDDPQPSFEPGDDNEMHGNAVQALKRAVVVLKGGTDPYIKSKAVACAMVMHLVGDIHQPLHCATKYFLSNGAQHQDNGGNLESVLNGPKDVPNFNLHYFWDLAYRASFDPANGNVFFEPYCRVAELRDAVLPPNTTLDPDFDQWARESNAIARDFVYPGITATDNSKLCRLSSVYVDKARMIARAQLVLAARRLAALLNSTLGADQPGPPPPSYPAGPPSR
jgi:hypothetical protein